MKHMKKTGRPPLLTEQEITSQLDAVASISRGLAQARKGAGRRPLSILKSQFQL